MGLIYSRKFSFVIGFLSILCQPISCFLGHERWLSLPPPGWLQEAIHSENSTAAAPRLLCCRRTFAPGIPINVGAMEIGFKFISRLDEQIDTTGTHEKT